ncbi:hypothetical protein NMY22_g4056 [Coprinellus aureogranulatus]|nr:hypothetical protein NMY22_g4056 [Coprinellus aureogranulatus]
MHDIAVAMKGYCSGLKPEVIEEGGCCVCAQLTPRTDLVQFDESLYDLSVLEEVNCTRRERLSSQSPVEGINAPILDSSLATICVSCHEALQRGHRPKMALANHLWVGAVPDCLKDLTLAEMAMVSRVRYSRCVVRISSGHAKMTANVIAFEHPTMKIYQRLPMPPDDLDDVLAVLYTGMEPPADDDLRRTPVLVRRKRVRTALEWLKNNHVDYTDLEIDYDALASYPLNNVPVGVFYKKIDGGEGNVPDAAKSMFDNTNEDGTSSGPCPYTVHGLTSERYTSMTTTQRKLAAVQQLKNGGKLLAVGHDTTPQSIFSNPRLYPQMFPWLFPYGLGGVDLDAHTGRMSREYHIKWLLMFHDKHFQRDAGFLIVLFNHQLIRQSSQGSFMMAKRSNFSKIVDTVHQLDPGVLRIISERLMNGGRAFPQTPEEHKAFRVFDQIDYVGTRVAGSIARKKYQRGEVWSLINFMNTPAWFITISPADNKHPLCIHWAGSDFEFKPDIKGYNERKLIITRNPVACARFFHHLVQLFIKHLCGWTEDGPKRGLFGMPAAFYGTVEQQGRMTLHLHFLLWIRGQLSLTEIREKLTENSAFAKELSDYIESCMVGGFSTGTKEEVESRVPRTDDYEDRGIHTILQPTASNVPADYINPTLTMPEAPPEEFCTDVDLCGCDNCEACRQWYSRFKCTLDDIMLRSNVHTCYDRVEPNDEARKEGTNGVPPTAGAETRDHVETERQTKRAGKSAKIVKAASKKKARRHGTAKGCIRKNGLCSARFPREVFMRTTVDRKTGHLNPKHTDSSVNDVAPAVTVSNRCNTDSRFLLSGTAVKATVGYVTDYITKAWLKTYQVFSSMYDTFTRHGGLLDDEERDSRHRARQMILKVVNSLSSKMEIGAPMAAMYLLGNPDHYTSHEFVTFYWKNYVNFVQGEWKALDTILEAPSGVSTSTEDMREDVGLVRSAGLTTVEDVEEAHLVDRNHRLDHAAPCEAEGDLDDDDDSESVGEVSNDTGVGEPVRLTREGNYYLAKSNTDDYRFRPTQLEDVSLYEFVQCAIKYPMRSTRAPRKDLRFFRLQEEHPQANTHVMACDPGRRFAIVPNFLGHPLPRRDVGDHEEYCCTMLTLFRPWRTGIDLKTVEETWEECFNQYTFTTRAKELMNNFNVRYECYDARDDYAAMMKDAGSHGEDDTESVEDDDSVFGDDGDGDGFSEDEDEDLLAGIGPATQSIQKANATMFQALRRAGWNSRQIPGTAENSLKLPQIAIDDALHSTAWRNIVKVAKMRAWRRKLSAMAAGDDGDIPKTGTIRNDAYIVPPTYLSKDFEPPDKRWSEVMRDVVKESTLNEGQEKAFRIVANHACEIAPDQLLMHLGGMAGTGKSTVIRALTSFFNARKEPYRFVLLGPTGTSAALIGGSTYHSFLGLNTGSGSTASVSTMEEVKERLTGVGYLLIDEQSMLNCRQLCAISARCCDALGIYEQPFGGLNVILCGDFAQLPPAKGYSLYSHAVSLRQSPRQSVAEQENTIGKLIWLQFTTVVILTQNMRQIDDLPQERAFQKALLNLRWHACTDEDIALFRSRIAEPSGDLSVDAEGFKNVSIITARNRDKDHLNSANSARFSSETGETMHDFYSIDSMLSAPASKDPSKKKRVYSQAKTISQKMQGALWQQPPCTSENVPGKLSLSVGMPVLIRHNEATELCMTRGQEGRVVGWSSVKLPKRPDRRSLDVLYIELIRPPHIVKLPHLPKNVVPLTKIPQPVDARLVNDEFVHISRSQVPVLPNFAMTDYSSQGKTRPWNVVDLTECRNFQAAYTCLSRGTKVSQTLILRDFDDEKLRGNSTAT